MDHVGFLSPPAERQMDLMTMMQQMDKFTEHSSTPPPMDLSTASTHTFDNITTTTQSLTMVNPILPTPTDGGHRRASVAAMREMIFRVAAMQPINIDPETVKPPKRRNVRISKDPQSVAARHRRERISERIRILQRLVPGGTKMDTASMLDEAIHYVKFLKTQLQSLERAAAGREAAVGGNFSGFLNPTQMLS